STSDSSSRACAKIASSGDKGSVIAATPRHTSGPSRAVPPGDATRGRQSGQDSSEGPPAGPPLKAGDRLPAPGPAATTQTQKCDRSGRADQASGGCRAAGDWLGGKDPAAVRDPAPLRGWLRNAGRTAPPSVPSAGVLVSPFCDAAAPNTSRR